MIKYLRKFGSIFATNKRDKNFIMQIWCFIFENCIFVAEKYLKIMIAL